MLLPTFNLRKTTQICNFTWSEMDCTKFMLRTEEVSDINPLNAELNSICYLLALLEAHLIFHVSRIRVNGKAIPLQVYYRP